MDQQQKQELYQRIIAKANPHLIAARMRELGFWPAGLPIPDEPPEARAERARIEAELLQLRSQHAAVKDPEAALAAERKRRWEESKLRRAQKKQQRAAEAKARKAAWEEVRRQKIRFLGHGVSAGLDGPEALATDEAKLKRLGLPVLRNATDVATALGIDLARLQWLTFHRQGAALVHYHRYGIPKKTGGVRPISAPKPALAAAQTWVLGTILERLIPTAEAHGFVRTRSVVTNATPHVKKPLVVNLDLKDFFPTYGFRRVKGLFRKGLGYGEQVATVLALLCTEPPRVEAELDEKTLWVALGDRHLPQGACTSPALTNILCTRLDRRLAGLSRAMGWAYTRYADDLTFSALDGTISPAELIGAVRRVLTSEGLVLNEDKTRVMRPGRRQEVTGVTVNERLSVARDEVRRLKAILHNCAKHGMASQNRENHPHFAAFLRGKVAWVQMVDPARGAKLAALLAQALAKP